MKKYLSVFKISFQQEFVYRLNFIMWRVRNVLQIFLIFFLWDTIFSDPGRVVFGYDRAKILTYIFGLAIMKAIVTSSRTIDVAGEISDGKLSNYLLKPVNYFKYWFTRDVASKSLNLIFAVFEVTILYFILKPPFFFQPNPLLLVLFLTSLLSGVLLYFFLLFIFDMFAMWYPEQGWGPIFFLFIFVEFLGGGLFPLDILPAAIQKGLYLTPFPYLYFIPLQIYLGKLGIIESLWATLVAGVWILVLGFTLKKLWQAGLAVYKSEGR
ncbi:hypothetical protein A2210_01465 [Candidatus Woesebacteria bacterium RIFOXYA1_FULL_40_18]|uniref:ABC-2 type transporter domain-containing protein n=4 Tax=Candidatus Woeseibacteriota TaxID=1752722 RepID=A0A1F8CIG4_9BACT|nr:MAG: hypothetical protein UT72_C0006G0018 [Candidatus Woesebacteria bacterium GW2011_GWB1_40_101]OGM75639.1 MAG: hypothetical protein A2210_01465 [Candidatus Woesebacteria bacterium RIFOXYA1_FULL_40_18]OGM80997.1 MAG: hypothetical protein A2361_01505 [Candidatus Woesebacteria bacterium RIFOXYB1_FULL_40_26]OGM87992.1 MAG: hypothetical protein A2614_01600 [Candidatus Woesebacteria bacterium RIFOXYD1_FULL_40_21]